MHTAIRDILKKNQLSVTESRTKILELFLEHPAALEHRDIEEKSGERFDRVTIYRTLQTFVEKGIIHTIPSSDNSVHYALCKNDCTEGHHHDNHIHFVCDSCETTYCLDGIVVPEVKLPKGFKPAQIDVVVNGLCNNCE